MYSILLLTIISMVSMGITEQNISDTLNALNLDNINIIQKSWNDLKEAVGDDHEAKISELVFSTLFTDYPYMKDFFIKFGESSDEIMNNPGFITHMKDKVFANLDHLFNSLHNPLEIMSKVAWINQIHRSKGVTSSDYENLGKTLFKVIKKALGSNMTPMIENAWQQGVTFLMAQITNPGI